MFNYRVTCMLVCIYCLANNTITMYIYKTNKFKESISPSLSDTIPISRPSPSYHLIDSYKSNPILY